MTIVDLEAAHAITALITEFCWRVDNGAGDRVAELFTANATLDAPHFSLAGRDEIHAWFVERATGGKRLSRHFFSNLRVTDEGEGRYKVEANAMTLVGAPPAPSHGARIAAGSSTDRLLHADGKWLFTSRRLDIVFEGSIAAPVPA